MRHCYTRI